MRAYNGDYLPGPYPFICGLSRVVIVYGSACGVRAVNGLPGRLIRGICHGGVYPAVIQAGKGTLLVNDTGERVGKGGMGNTVHYNCAHRHLSLVGLTPGFGRYYLCKQLYIAFRKSSIVSTAGTSAPR